MRIIFVRHGHPNYRNDCLTEIGHRHAEAAALRLCNEKIEKIYSSSCGRAVETAEHIAEKFGLPVLKCDFMREINWGSINGEPLFQNGHPWFTIDDMIANGQSLTNIDWAKSPIFSNNKVISSVQKIGEELDRFLASLGFDREGDYYRVRKYNDTTIVMASHGGSSSAALAHLFHLTFPHACAIIRPDYTAITIVTLHGKEGCLVSPQFELLNDARHISDISAQNVYDK